MFKYVNIFFILLFFTKISAANIITTNNFETIKNNILTADSRDVSNNSSNILVIFDVDEVLLQPTDQILNIKHSKELQTMFDNLNSKLTEQQLQELNSLIMLQRPIKPVDPRFIALINTLQQQQIKTLALTQCSTGSLGKVANLENWRIQELKKLGYHFDKSWKNINTKFFHALRSSVDLKRTPAFKQGVIFSCGVPKSEPLKAFLYYSNFHPKKIIFIDDKLKNITSIEKFTKQNNIMFLGIQYTKVATTKLPALNQKMVQLQFDILYKTHKWLPDTKVKKIVSP